jgi:hypothetical protein
LGRQEGRCTNILVPDFHVFTFCQVTRSNILFIFSICWTGIINTKVVPNLIKLCYYTFLFHFRRFFIWIGLLRCSSALGYIFLVSFCTLYFQVIWDGLWQKLCMIYQKYFFINIWAVFYHFSQQQWFHATVIKKQKKQTFNFVFFMRSFNNDFLSFWIQALIWNINLIKVGASKSCFYAY